MRSGWNPVRRSRKIGTKAQGHGADNRLVIPERWDSFRSYFERLCNYRLVSREIGGREIDFYVEPTRVDWFYPCSIDDIAHALSFCSTTELELIDFFVLRQPTRKQRILAPVWGRAIWEFDLGQRSGAAIVIEAQSLATIKWQSSLNPELMRELRRLEADGHRIVRTRQANIIRPSVASLRATVLYRTVFHELGHHIDYQRSSADEWCGKTKSTKEDFAHRFAEEKTAQLFKQGHLPFNAILDDESLARDDLRREWFSPETPAGEMAA